MAEEYVSIDELANRVIRDMTQYSDEVVNRSKEVAKAVRNQMKPMLEERSPIRKYSTNTQIVKRIIVHRGENVPKAVRQIKEEKYQPGYFKRGWVQGIVKVNNHRELYGVYNKNIPTIPHLLNTTHDIVAHDIKYYNAAAGTQLITDVQNWGEKELERRLSEFLEKE